MPKIISTGMKVRDPLHLVMLALKLKRKSLIVRLCNNFIINYQYYYRNNHVQICKLGIVHIKNLQFYYVDNFLQKIIKQFVMFPYGYLNMYLMLLTKLYEFLMQYEYSIFLSFKIILIYKHHTFTESLTQIKLSMYSLTYDLVQLIFQSINRY